MPKETIKMDELIAFSVQQLRELWEHGCSFFLYKPPVYNIDKNFNNFQWKDLSKLICLKHYNRLIIC